MPFTIIHKKGVILQIPGCDREIICFSRAAFADAKLCEATGLDQGRVAGPELCAEISDFEHGEDPPLELKRWICLASISEGGGEYRWDVSAFLVSLKRLLSVQNHFRN